MRTINKREVGGRFERKACEYMAARGFRVLERNFRCRQGEVDVVGEDGGYLVFVEVKYRASGTAGSPAEAVTAAKQKKICRTADYYRYRHGIGDDRAVRYDVVAIEGLDGKNIKEKDGKEKHGKEKHGKTENGERKNIKAGNAKEKAIEESFRIDWYKNAFSHVYAPNR